MFYGSYSYDARGELLPTQIPSFTHASAANCLADWIEVIKQHIEVMFVLFHEWKDLEPTGGF
jgi:hypothetical protein